MKRNLILIATAVIAFAFVGCGGKEGAKTPEDAINQFYAHLDKKEFKEAKALATTESASEVEKIENELSKAKEKTEFKVEDLKCEIKEDAATCTMKLNGEEQKIELKKVDGGWKLVYKYAAKEAENTEDDASGPDEAYVPADQIQDDVAEEQ